MISLIMSYFIISPTLGIKIKIKGFKIFKNYAIVKSYQNCCTKASSLEVFTFEVKIRDWLSRSSTISWAIEVANSQLGLSIGNHFIRCHCFLSDLKVINISIILYAMDNIQHGKMQEIWNPFHTQNKLFQKYF